MAQQRIRVAAVGDVHAAEFTRATVETAFCDLAEEADVLLVAGDLTAHGTPEEAAILGEALAATGVPAYAVLGNHDHHAERADEVNAAMEEHGVTMLERATATLTTDAGTLGVVGLKGFVGGFAGSHLPDFGEPLLRQVYRVTSEDVEALDAGLRELEGCDRRAVVMHYAPTASTLDGEPLGIHAFLGCDRFGAPLTEHKPDLVVHGHAHAGTYEGAIGELPVYNVAQPLIGKAYAVFEL